MKFSVVGAGYVGLSLAVLISQKYEVSLLDTSEAKINSINQKISPIKDYELEKHLVEKKLKLIATTNKEEAYKNSNFTIIATPTNYNESAESFDTSSVETVISEIIEYNNKSTIVIKSTIPFGFTERMRQKFNIKNLFFSPEFLRESKALYDNLYPSRVVVGDISKNAEIFANILVECCNKTKNDVPIFKMTSKEAEAVKLFANTFLAMRVSFFNELDSFSEIESLSSKKIIQGLSSDTRIGDYYNNPSFGYGGYCLPKDTKQLLDNFKNVPNNIIRAVVEANQTRKNFIVESIINKSPKTVGVYRLIMKEGSDNFRESAVIDILKSLQNKNIKILLFEPFISNNTFEGIEVVNELEKFITSSDLIIANRASNDLKDVMDKVYTRDLYREN